MLTSPLIHLTDRAVIRIAGADAHHFLQNLVTADIEKVDEQKAGYAALLTPQGKILFDFLIYRTDDGYLLDVAKETAAELLKRLTFYRLRAKVELALCDEQTAVFAAAGDALPAVDNALAGVPDPRLDSLGFRLVAPLDTVKDSGLPLGDLHAYETNRIKQGVPEGLKDYDYSDIFPHDADMDQLNGVSFSKGCYVGQEVVSRVHHRGTARKRFVKLDSAGHLPAKGADIAAGGKSVGAIGSSTEIDGKVKGLALVRLDKVRQALDNGTPLSCGDVAVTVSLPDWAGFGWPDTADT